MIDAVLAGEGDPDEVVAARGLAVVSDEGALTAAVDEAIAANPDVAAKVRDGKVAAAGVLVGAVMKATRGQADAARVRELILAAPEPRPLSKSAQAHTLPLKPIAPVLAYAPAPKLRTQEVQCQ